MGKNEQEAGIKDERKEENMRENCENKKNTREEEERRWENLSRWEEMRRKMEKKEKKSEKREKVWKKFKMNRKVEDEQIQRNPNKSGNIVWMSIGHCPISVDKISSNSRSNINCTHKILLQ